ncbi:MAG TPA: magnesium/cobalt transporter CorA [Deltaproteobacteria bacterium]|nr:magnesium/cobalt transporter CorA [Deltaproteobacteria bacterium]
MSRVLRKTSQKAGLSPGALIHIGERRVESVKISIMDYDRASFHEQQVRTIEECFPFKETPTITWINIDGLHQVDIIEKIGRHFKIHPLIQEDILHMGQRPKMEDLDEYILIILKMLHYDETTDTVSAEQVSIILGSNFVISFQEASGDVFNSLRERIRSGKGRIRRMGADYLAYALIDSIVDHYFIILEKCGDRVEHLEEELARDPRLQTLQSIHTLKREIIFLRKSVWPLREVISGLERAESPLIHDDISMYLRDVYDHTIQVVDSVETYQDLLSGMLDLYLSSVSNKMNEVMKVLTIFASIFIPLTFLAGIYGMNFEFMPELKVWWAYPALLFVMISVAVALIVFFKRKRWL